MNDGGVTLFMNSKNFQLEIFLECNQYLFTIFGIFGALSIYLSTLSKEHPDLLFVDLGTASSFFIFLVVSTLILKKSVESNGEPFPLSILTWKEENIYRLIFVIPFIILIFVMSSFIYINFQNELNAIGLYFYNFVGVMAFMGVMQKYLHKTKTFYLLASMIFIISVLAFDYANTHHFLLFSGFFSGVVTASLLIIIIKILIDISDILKK